MKIKYFEDTDTAHVEFSARTPVETSEISGNLFVDFDAQGNVASMTIEHASAQTDMRELIFQRIAESG